MHMHLQANGRMLVEPPTEGFITHMKRDKGTQYEHAVKR
jgi:hypothetical protein